MYFDRSSYEGTCSSSAILLATFLALITANQGECPPCSLTMVAINVCRSACTSEVKCSRDTALLRIGNCMTYNRVSEDTEIGQYPYFSQHFNLQKDNYYFQLPNHTFNLSLTSFMCGSLHRTGQLCGECEDGFGPALYSYTLEYKKYRGYDLGWILYVSLNYCYTITTCILYCCSLPCQCNFTTIS